MATIHQFTPKSQPAALRCPSCGTTTDAPCSCGIDYEYISPGKLAAQAIKDNPNMSNRVIADKIGTNETTVRRARKLTAANAAVDLKSTAANAAVEKRIGKDGEARKMPRRRTPVEKVNVAIRAREQGKTLAEAAKAAGLTSVQPVKTGEAYQQGRADLLTELNVDPATLALSAAAKLTAAKRMMERKLNAEHAARMRGLEEEVRQRVLAEGKQYLDRLNEMEQEARDTVARYREYTNNHKPLFTFDQFNLLRKCLHQGGVAASPQEFDVAFNLIQTNKFKLTGQK